jgi:hypothetical protein
MDNPPDRLPTECLDGDGDATSGARDDNSRHRKQMVASATELRQPDDVFTWLERPIMHGEAVLWTMSHADLPVQHRNNGRARHEHSLISGHQNGPVVSHWPVRIARSPSVELAHQDLFQ